VLNFIYAAMHPTHTDACPLTQVSLSWQHQCQSHQQADSPVFIISDTPWGHKIARQTHPS